MDYRVVKGEFIIEGKKPDGDSLRFKPRDMSLLQFEGFDDVRARDGTVQLRFEGVDAPELHYREDDIRQPRSIGARTFLLEALMGFGDVKYDVNDATGVPTLSVAFAPERVFGAILTNRGNAGSYESLRAVAYVLLQADVTAAKLRDGQELDADTVADRGLLEKTVNYKLVEAGEAYPYAFTETSAKHRAIFQKGAKIARDADLGVWKRDRTASFRLDRIQVGAGPNSQLILPMLFRRCIDYLQAVKGIAPEARPTLPEWLKSTESALNPAEDRNVHVQLAGVDKPLSELLADDGTTVTFAAAEFAAGASLLDLVVAPSTEDLIPLADPELWRGLAPGEAPWMYRQSYDRGDTIHALLQEMSGCRAPTCKVPQLHPFYRGEAPVFPEGGVPFQRQVTKPACMAVVPTRTARRRVMIVGSFPTARFTTRIGSDGTLEPFVPTGDISAPLEGVPYFDGYKARDVLTANIFASDYLGEIGIDLETDVWMTNLIKCFLFKPAHVRAYRELGWAPKDGPNDPYRVDVEATAYQHLPAIGEVCGARFLAEEAKLCDPKLIITLGKWAAAFMHGILDQALNETDEAREDEPRPPSFFTRLVGVKLRAGQVEPREAAIPRKPPFDDFNVMHLYHPEAVLRGQRQPASNVVVAHQRSLEELKAFIEEVGALT